MSRNSCTVPVLLKPGAAHNRIAFLDDETLALWVTSRPVDGKANAHAAAFLAETLGIPKGAVTLVRGITSRHKVFSVSGLSRDEIKSRISATTRIRRKKT